jgi:hypothetical protein
MKKFTVSCLLASILCAGLTAQVFVIERENGDFLSFGTVADAIEELADGDKFYVPPGVHAGPHTIDKGVSIIGAGYDASQFSGTITLSGNNISVTGIRFSNPSTSLILDNVSHLNMTRCWVQGNVSRAGTAGNNNFVSECVFVGAFGTSSSFPHNGFVIAKSVFRSSITVTGSEIKNSLFLGIGLLWSSTVSTTTFRNCIIAHNRDGAGTTINVSGISLSTFKHNLFVGIAPIFTTNNVTFDYTNSTNLLFIETFAGNPALNAAPEAFVLHHDSPGVNGGDDGKDVGIFGTHRPFKAGGLPSAPAFTLKNIAPETDAAGNLPVTIRIEAQER